MHLPDSGLVLLRSGWDDGSHYALFDVGPYSRGHSHQDKLNLILWPYGRRVLTASRSVGSCRGAPHLAQRTPPEGAGWAAGGYCMVKLSRDAESIR